MDNKTLKTMLNRKNRFFKNYKRHGYRLEDKVRLDNCRKICQETVENAKSTYLANMGKNKVMNKCKAFVLNYREKAKLLTEFFSR